MVGMKFFFLALCLVGCSPASLQEIRSKADFEMKKLTEELRRIETKEDLHHRSKQIKKRFDSMADLLVKTRDFGATSTEPSKAAELLFAELARIYEIPGAREVIEHLQEEAVHKIDVSHLH